MQLKGSATRCQAHSHRLFSKYLPWIGPAAILFLILCCNASLSLAAPIDCGGCHQNQADQFKASVHKGAVRCQDCHGGNDYYEVAAADAERWKEMLGKKTKGAGPPFDHGKAFRGKASRDKVPERCGNCHSDVERMNPYGLLTDQLSSYWVSGHGKRLKNQGDTRVAVCIDCHGTHDVLRHDNPQSRTYFRNIPATCGRCHSDPKLMGEFDIPATIPDQYRKSIHGHNVIEKGDSGSPTCATCHGSHAAAPPGYLEVSHVCGRCHKQVEEYFLTSTHGRIPAMARCIGCHGKGGDRRNHQIEKASPAMDTVLQTYLKALGGPHDQVDGVRKQFVEQVDAQSGLRLDVVCSNCHASGRRHDPHSVFFETTDQAAAKYGTELSGLLRDAQFEYARTAERTNRLGRGVLLLKDEALRVEDAKTEVMALTSFIHTLNRTEIVARDQKVRDICKEVNASLDQKEAGVVRWRLSSLPIWGFIALFSVLMYRKYLSLRRVYVAPNAAHPAPAGACLLPSGLGGIAQERRRFFDVVLSVMGSFAIVGLLWPAIAYVLPVRKRGGAADRVSAGKEDGWQPWEGRKVSVTGKPVIVVRTDKGFSAHSAVCTHLGCIVHWTPGKKEFECPCHAARFDGEGQVIAGPPPGPLPAYSAAVVQGEVMVSPAKSA